MTLFKKNFSYKRGWQFANKLKLFTLFFVMLTSLIAGATSVSAQGVNPEGWDYYPNLISGRGIVAKLYYEGEVACASTGQGCLLVNAKSEIVFADLKPLKCGSMHAGIYGSPGYGDWNHWCEKLDRIKKTALLNIRPQEWNYYPNRRIVAHLNYQGEVACASTYGRGCLHVNAKSEINFKDLKPLKCGSEHAGIYGNTGYNSRNLNHWCRKLKEMRNKGQPNPPTPPSPVDPGTPDKPDVSGGKPKPPVAPAKPDKPDVSGGKPKPPVAPAKPDKPDVSGGKPKPPVAPAKPDKPDVSGGKPKPPVAPAKPDKPDVSGGKPKPPVAPAKPDKPALGTGVELTSKPDQLKWFSGKTIGFDGVVTPEYQGQAACASTDGVSCLKNVAVKDINFATLKPVKCMVADYNNPQHWCAKVKKHAVFLFLQSRDYYARPSIDGLKFILEQQVPNLQEGEPGSVLALSGSFMGLSSDSLSYEYADLAYKVLISNNAEITSKLKIPVSCNPNWLAYAGSSVSEVVNNIEATSDICAQEFFKAAKISRHNHSIDNVKNLFKAEVVQEAVDKLQAYLTPWDGVIKNKEIYNLTVFLRAYKYVTFYNSTVSVNPALETKITALFSRGLTYGNGFFGMDAKLEKIRTNSLQSSMLYELIMAQGNYNSWSSDGIDYITKVIRDFNPATFNTLSVKERTAVARILSSIFAALYYDTTIKAKIENDPLFETAYEALVVKLVKFSLDKKVASYPNLALNAARESVRYTLAYAIQRSIFYNSYSGYASISSINRPELYAIFVKAVNDAGICRDFGTCNDRPALISAVFPMTYKCGDASVDFRYDTASTTQGEIMQLCTDFIKTSTEFASKMGVTLSAPLESNDMKGHTLKMYVYNKVSDWRLYGRSIFGLGTSSPGAFVDNYGKSKAPEAHIFRTGSDLTFGKAPFWNAVHEYTHYLVSKYIRKGGSAELSDIDTEILTWFEAGVAEYFHSDLYQGRNVVASSGPNLGYLPWFKKGVNWDTIVVGLDGTRRGRPTQSLAIDQVYVHLYSGGYAVVKYLLEEQPKDFNKLTAFLQAGDINGFDSLLKMEIQGAYNNEFNAWLANKAK